ncbi:3-oxoacyl-ACP reductase, partial [bacterium]
MKLDGKTALVLGAIKGIGRGIALALAEAGCRLALTYFDWPEALPSLRRDLAAAGVDHLLVQADLRRAEAAAMVVDRVMARFGRLDILINNIERGG